MEYAIFFDAPPMFDDEGAVISDTLDYSDETCIGDGFEDALESSETFKSLCEEVLDVYGDTDDASNSNGVSVARPVWVVAKNDGSVQKFNVVVELRIEPADEV